MLVSCTAELFAKSGSNSLHDTSTVFVRIPSASGITVIVTVTEAPGRSEPISASRIPPLLVTLPWLVVAERNATVSGRISVCS